MGQRPEPVACEINNGQSRDPGLIRGTIFMGPLVQW